MPASPREKPWRLTFLLWRHVIAPWSRKSFSSAIESEGIKRGFPANCEVPIAIFGSVVLSFHFLILREGYDD
jgi:hypothetical protein